MQRFAVFGHPVAHSLSPRIHAAFARQCGIDMHYGAIDAPPESFPALLAQFAVDGGRGANVTLPLKQDAATLCATISERAQRAGAVNALRRDGNAWHGDNTDGIGLVRDLTERHGIDLRTRRVLLLGAGGAARGVAPALLDADIGELVIINRTAQRAEALVQILNDPARASEGPMASLPTLGAFELIINTTSAARNGQPPVLPASLCGAGTVAVDLNYGDAAIPFLAWSRAAGAREAIDGLGMLVEQAAESFVLWHGVRPGTEAVLAELRT